jgi:gliding motility-associated-like protein
MKRVFILALSYLLSLSSSFAQVIINEYSCSNLNIINDAFGQKEDWVELYNTGATPVSLSGYYLSDNKYAPQKWQIPAGVTIPASGRMMVFCSDRGVFQSGQLHPTFKLTQMKGTEYFVLANSAGSIVDSVHLLPTQANHSRGRKTDGAAQWGVFDIPSPNGANGNAKDGYATKPLFSVAPGFYSATQNITISSPDPNVSIRYTTDGSTPTIGSTLYTVPVVVAATSVVRARAFSTNLLILPSFIETNTYLINEVTTMNVISVAGPYNTLFGGFGGNPIFNTFEFFDKNKNFKFEFEGESRKHGNDSWAYQQKGFRVYVDDELGYDYAIKYKLFNTTPRDTFDQIILKAGASDNYPGNVGNPSCHLRDVFVHTLAHKYNLETDGRKYEPAILFINGQYWGVYEIREKVNRDYFEYYYGQSKTKVDHLSYWGGLNIRAGSDTGWVNLYNFIMNNNMAIPANYNHVTNFLNTKSLIEYFIINTWLVNTDWLNWNTMWWRGRKGAGVKWRYALWDEDNVLALGQNYSGMNTVTYQNDPCQPFTMFQNNSTIKHTDMLNRLMNNATFQQLYKNTFIDMLNGPLNCDNMLPHFDSIVNIIQPEMQRQCTRWGGVYTTWQANIQFMRNQIVNRCAVIAQKLDSCMNLNPQRISFNVSPAAAGTIQWDGVTKAPYVWSKVIAADTIINLSTTPTNAYYFFDHWENYTAGNSWNPDSVTSSTTFNFKTKDSVVAYFKYFNPDSVIITFDVSPAGKGVIKLNNVQIPSYPYSVKIDRRFAYALEAIPTGSYNFFNWNKKRTTSAITPNAITPNVSYTFSEADTVIANFQYTPGNSNLPGSSPVPAIDQTITIPSAFSPNGDGKNDLYFIRGKNGNVKEIQLKIFNRFGEIVFSTDNMQEGWDGKYKGETVDVGTYFYVLRVTFDNTYQAVKKTYKGDITVIR